MAQAIEDLLRQAENAYSAGDVVASYALVTKGLQESPDDQRLLLLAGRAGLDAGAEGTVELLRRLVELAPADAEAWQTLGLAEINEGDLASAQRSLRRALELDAQDRETLVSLGHVTYMLGDAEEATTLLARASAASPDDPAALRNLLDMYWAAGRTEDALRTAEALVESRSEDVLALLDLAELRMLAGDLDGSVAAYQQLRRTDDEAGHATYAYHGMIEVEVQRENWRRALDLAIAATAGDRHQLTTDLLAFVSAKLFGETDRSAPSGDDLVRMLAERRSEHRRAHAEALLAEGVVL